MHWQAACSALWQSPYLGIFLTLLSFQLGLFLYRRSGAQPWLHPVLVSVVSLCGVILYTNLSYERYMDSAYFLSQLLGPAIVALAVPLYENFKLLRRYWLAFTVSNLVAGAFTVGLAVAIVALGQGSEVSVNSMWTKSITTAIAMEVAPGIGGVAALAAALVMFTGILGSLIAPALFKLFNITHGAAQGTALGVCAHAVGTARALEMGSLQGAFAALSMSFMGVLCALLLPFLA
ncbi:MAG: LrgB family protein [Bermanella sp.]